MSSQRDSYSMFVSVCRSFMIEQLQREVPEYLLERKVLTQQEFETIVSYHSREDQITYLLDILPNKSSDQFTQFYQYLSTWYPWILDHFKAIKGTSDEPELKTALDQGEVPNLPSFYAHRKDEFLRLLNILHELERNEYVVVHGMRGCGKSTLVSSTLYQSKSLVLDTFEKKVFWVSLGSEVDEFSIQLDLCVRLAPFYVSQSLPSDSASAIRYLKDRFAREEMENCLLILDDVPSASVVSALDVGCKILITTDDENIMNGVKKPIKYLKVSDGFTEKETLKLFSESIDLEQLPPSAKNIHAMCKGFPLTISLISTQLAERKEDVRENPSRWKVYESRLKQNGIGAAFGLFDRTRSREMALLYRAIEMSIDCLDDELKKMYKTFALFMEDVNIRPEVLSILWDRNESEVIDIMREFEKKNLVIRAWNSIKKTYIYCVHDLLLGYLKKNIDPVGKRNLHQKIIACYRQKFGNDFINFPVDDNYILLYLGYHLKEADMTEEFPNLYFNLVFIEKKITHYGAADLLFDFKKYKPEISQGETFSKKYEDFLHFIRREAACKSLSNCNLVQFGLFESKDSEVYKAALELKRFHDPSFSVNSYFELLTQAPVEDLPPNPFHDRDEIVSAAFICSGDVLVANSKGLIRRMHVSENLFQAIKTFEGHTERVTRLQVTSQNYFLSASDDATVRVWNVNGADYGSGDFGNRRTPSPQIKQKDWQDPWRAQRPAGEQAVAILEHEVPIRWAQFSNNPNMNIVTLDVNGCVSVRFSGIEKEGNEMILRYQDPIDIDTKDGLNTCSFSNDDTLVLCSDNNGIIYIYNVISRDLIRRLMLKNCDVKAMLVIPKISLISVVMVGDSDFYVIDIDPEENDTVCELQPEVRSVSSYGRKRKDNYLCAAVSWDGKYVAIATTNYNLHVYNIKTGQEVLKFSESNGMFASLCWSLQNNLLLTSYDQSKVIKIWTVEKDGVLNNSVKLRRAAFDAAWIPDNDGEDQDTYITAVLDDRNHIHVFNNLRPVKEEESPSSGKEILQVCVCPQDGNVVFALRGGEIFVMDTNLWEKRKILDAPQEPVLKMKTFGARVELPCGNVQNISLVLVSTGTEIGEHSLMAWEKIMTESSDAVDLGILERIITFKPLPRELIRDYVADVQNNKLYLVTINHVFSIYDLSTGDLIRVEDLKTYKLDAYLEDMKYCDISSDFSCIVTGNEKQRFIRSVCGNTGFIDHSLDVAMRICKLSPDAKYLFVGFEDSSIEVFNSLKRSKVKVNHLNKFKPGPVLDAVWSPSSDRFIVIFDREMSLFKMNDDIIELLAHLYMSVDRLVCNKAFTKSVTVDSSGNFRVLKHPL